MKSKFQKGYSQIFALLSLFFLGATLIAGLYLSQQNQNSKTNAADSTKADQFQIQMGDEEYVTGPVSDFLDNSFFVMPANGSLKAYSANNKTRLFSGANLNTINWGSSSSNQNLVVLSAGPAGNFDECGAWLGSAWKKTELHWFGWYHAEQQCDYSKNGQTHKSMAFVESFDGGRTWAKTGYPNNQVITADKNLNNNPETWNAGDAKVVPGGDHLYMFFLASDYKWHVARSAIKDGGKPGSWYKYYNGSFSEPGIGGKSSPTNALNGLTFNTFLGKHLTMDVSGKWGFFLRTSSNGNITYWDYFPDKILEKSVYPAVSKDSDVNVDNWWNRTPNSKELYAYPSIINLDGDIFKTGRQFYLYYVKVFAGDSLDTDRFLLRRKITLSKTSSNFYSKVFLNRYEKQNPSKTRVSTELAKPSEGYIKSQKMGSLLTYPQTGFSPIYECYIPAWQDYFVTGVNPERFDWQHCESIGDKFIRRIGWVSTTKTDVNQIPLYRCFDKPNFNHFLSVDPKCEGKTTEFLLGYAF